MRAESVTPDARKHLDNTTYVKAPESLYSTAYCFKTRKMACGNARLELRKAVKLSQATKDAQAIDFLERVPRKGSGNDSHKAILFSGSLSKFCLLQMQRMAFSWLERLTQALHSESTRQLLTEEQQKYPEEQGGDNCFSRYLIGWALVQGRGTTCRQMPGLQTDLGNSRILSFQHLSSSWISCWRKLVCISHAQN